MLLTSSRRCKACKSGVHPCRGHRNEDFGRGGESEGRGAQHVDGLGICRRLVPLALYWLQIVEATANEASQAEQTVSDTMASQSQGGSCLQLSTITCQLPEVMKRLGRCLTNVSCSCHFKLQNRACMRRRRPTAPECAKRVGESVAMCSHERGNCLLRQT